MNDQPNALAMLSLRKERTCPRYPLERRLYGAQNRSGRGGESFNTTSGTKRIRTLCPIILQQKQGFELRTAVSANCPLRHKLEKIIYETKIQRKDNGRLCSAWKARSWM